MMLDVGWLLSRASDGVRLREDYRLLKGDRTMEVVGQAIGLSLNDLRKDSRRVVGQLVGRLMAVAGVGGEETNGEGKRQVNFTKKNNELLIC